MSQVFSKCLRYLVNVLGNFSKCIRYLVNVTGITAKKIEFRDACHVLKCDRNFRQQISYEYPVMEISHVDIYTAPKDC